MAKKRKSEKILKKTSEKFGGWENVLTFAARLRKTDNKKFIDSIETSVKGRG
ncbi:MAG: hypothetical protein HUJ89_00525 [Bacteroidales bacterium]|nr:hypothetical protein [Bacteroidales bacterium]